MEAYLRPQVSWHFIKMTIIRQRTKDNEEIEKIEKYSQKNVRIVYNLWCVCGGIFVYYCVWMGKYCFVCVCMTIYAPHDKFEVVSWMYEMRGVAKFVTDWLRKIFLFISLYIRACVCVWWWF